MSLSGTLLRRPLNPISPILNPWDEFVSINNHRSIVGATIREINRHAFHCTPPRVNYDNLNSMRMMDFLLKMAMPCFCCSWSYFVDVGAPRERMKSKQETGSINGIKRWFRFSRQAKEIHAQIEPLWICLKIFWSQYQIKFGHCHLLVFAASKIFKYSTFWGKFCFSECFRLNCCRWHSPSCQTNMCYRLWMAMG